MERSFRVYLAFQLTGHRGDGWKLSVVRRPLKVVCDEVAFHRMQ